MSYKFAFLVIYASCLISCTQRGKSPDNLNSYALDGDTIIANTFDTLRNTLLRAIGEKGFQGAIEFCNANALLLTNTYAAENIVIRRTSDKLRNQGNAPDSMEQRILATYLRSKHNQETLQPVVEIDAKGNHHYYKPIMIQAMCLNCHGDKNKQIEPATWQAIQAKYPADAAFDYNVGDLRGIWHVNFNKEKK
jgi:hypothetical protein